MNMTCAPLKIPRKTCWTELFMATSIRYRRDRMAYGAADSTMNAANDVYGSEIAPDAARILLRYCKSRRTIKNVKIILKSLFYAYTRIYFPQQIFLQPYACAILRTSNIQKGYEHIPASRCGFYDLFYPRLQVTLWINTYFLPFYVYTHVEIPFILVSYCYLPAHYCTIALVLFLMHWIERCGTSSTC